jgi:Cys-rich protein (TIGR04453 family)
MENYKMNSIKRLLIFSILLGAASFTLNADECNKACDKFITCTEQFHNRKATASEKGLLTKGCSESCIKFNDKIMECYKESQKANSSCGTYQQCIMKYASAVKNSKK